MNTYISFFPANRMIVLIVIMSGIDLHIQGPTGLGVRKSAINFAKFKTCTRQSGLSDRMSRESVSQSLGIIL